MNVKQHSENDLPEKLKLHAVYYFASVQKAKAALKPTAEFRLVGAKPKL